MVFSVSAVLAVLVAVLLFGGAVAIAIGWQLEVLGLLGSDDSWRTPSIGEHETGWDDETRSDDETR
ncbi:hypothetical protein [Haloarchaeobius sp. TZWWS8]|uniref:hypothetical protein n=1 Tax=Haloarchaeobius sp. TZWWS8 TaxID=3446121 RepID=UPI003EBE4BF0